MCQTVGVTVTDKVSSEDHKALQNIYYGMVRRCHDPRRKDYPKYGGRGITVCDEWREGFPVFEQWAMSHGFKKGMTLDRIANARGYNPNNCRWISKKAQGYNRKTNRYIAMDNQVRTLEEWCKIYDITPDLVIHRVQRSKCTYQEAIKKPVNRRKKNADS